MFQSHAFHHLHLLPSLTFNFILFSLNLTFDLQPLTSLFKEGNKDVLFHQQILKGSMKVNLWEALNTRKIGHEVSSM